MTDPTDKNEDKSEEGFFMAGFSGATGVPLKQMQDAIAQSTANQVTQGTISNVKISDTIRTDSVPVGISLWQTQRATDSPITGNVSTTIIVKPISSGQYSSALLFGSGAVFVASGLASSGDFTWTY